MGSLLFLLTKIFRLIKEGNGAQFEINIQKLTCGHFKLSKLNVYYVRRFSKSESDFPITESLRR